MNRMLVMLVGQVVVVVGALFFTNWFTQPTQVAARVAQPPVYGHKIINTYPHDKQAFTQGLIYDSGFFYESTGLNGRSSLRKVEVETGRVLQIRQLADQYFGEGLTLWRNQLIQLTWLNRVGFVYDKETFTQLREFSYTTEGWGITHDGRRLIMSDGSSVLYFLHPETFQRIGRLQVREGDKPVPTLNELEYIKGEIYANLWYGSGFPPDRIARISPETGQVLSWIDLSGLLTPEEISQGADILNGIAYDAEKDRLFVTGKLWPKVFEIEVVPKP